MLAWLDPFAAKAAKGQSEIGAGWNTVLSPAMSGAQPVYPSGLVQIGEQCVGDPAQLVMPLASNASRFPWTCAGWTSPPVPM